MTKVWSATVVPKSVPISNSQFILSCIFLIKMSGIFLSFIKAFYNSGLTKLSHIICLSSSSCHLSSSQISLIVWLLTSKRSLISSPHLECCSPNSLNFKCVILQDVIQVLPSLRNASQHFGNSLFFWISLTSYMPCVLFAFWTSYKIDICLIQHCFPQSN